MQRYALGIEYCGTHYRGWQTQQDGVPSIQGTLEQVLSKVANHTVLLHGAGRTDAGVHATNMVAHFDSAAERSDYGWIRGCNSQLPKDISIQWIQRIDDTFHARFQATARRYRYIIYQAAQRPALLHKQVTHINCPLDFQAMLQAAIKFEGTHNFESFRASACQSKQPVRHVTHCKLSQHGPFIILDIQADGFLHHMVRNIVGCLLDVGQHVHSIAHIDTIFAAEDRKAAGKTASADGLYFIQAHYPDHFQLPHISLGPQWLNWPN